MKGVAAKKAGHHVSGVCKTKLMIPAGWYDEALGPSTLPQCWMVSKNQRSPVSFKRVTSD